MSRSNNTELRSPATRFFEWKGGNGTLSYYDKEKKENVGVKLPFVFMVLERVAQVGGGYGRGKDFQSLWSNAVKDVSRDVFTVRSKAGIYKVGLWKDIKDNATKFVNGLYIAYKDDNGELTIGYLKLEGAANSAWIDFTKQKDIYKGVYVINGSVLDDSGTVKFYSPKFDWKDNVSEEAEAEALRLDADVLQPYLTTYFAKKADATPDMDTTGEAYEPEYSGEPEMPPFNPSDNDAPADDIQW